MNLLLPAYINEWWKHAVAVHPNPKSPYPAKLGCIGTWMNTGLNACMNDVDWMNAWMNEWMNLLLTAYINELWKHVAVAHPTPKCPYPAKLGCISIGMKHPRSVMRAESARGRPGGVGSGPAARALRALYGGVVFFNPIQYRRYYG